jgi:membrane-associated phospholipid phosphatase
MRSPHHAPRARIPTIAVPTRRRASRLLALLFAAGAISACSDGAIPTNPTLSAPEAIRAASTTRNDPSKAPATLAWQATARGLVASRNVSPIAAVRIYALLGVAQYGAAVAADEARGIRGNDDESETFDTEDEGRRAQHETRRGAIDAASLSVLKMLFTDATATAALQAQFDAELAAAKDRAPQFLAGKAIGESMGGAMTTWASTDGFRATWQQPRYPLWPEGAAPGRWYQDPAPLNPPGPIPAPAGFQLPEMRPYFMDSPGQFHPAAPPSFGSVAFLAALDTVRQIAATRTAAQIRAANQWNLAAGTATALGYWDEQAALYIDERKLGERSASHILALANAAALDATIGCWEAKYSIGFLRPYQNAGGISTVFRTPNHPSYPSGHSCVSAAAATVLAAYFPEKTVELNARVDSAGMSRVYAGIHYKFDVAAGQTLGREAAQQALNYDRTHGLLSAVGR